MLESLPHIEIPDTIQIGSEATLPLLTVAAVLGIAMLLSLPRIVSALLAGFLPAETKEVYQQVIIPNRGRLGTTLALMAADIALLAIPDLSGGLLIGEYVLGLAVAFSICYTGFGIFGQVFEVYLLDFALRTKRVANSELLVLVKFFANTIVILIVTLVFAQTHRINLTGLLASVGLGGIALAFASQKVLEQLLWTVLLYIDRPFVTDDYIHLSDGTFGRVESVGWRSTKIRLSGKGTLVVIPNSMLTQMPIENLSGAQKTIAIVNVDFSRQIPEEEKALVRQIILSSTKAIYGIDHKLTEVTFHELPAANNGNSPSSQAQVTIFVLGSGEVAMELRQQLLEVARQNITKQLKDYGIGFKIEENAVNIDSPMNI